MIWIEISGPQCPIRKSWSHLSFSDIVLRSEPAIVVVDEEDVDEDGRVDQEGEGKHKQERPLDSHFHSRLDHCRPLEADL